MTFLDTIITQQADGIFTTGVYRKPTHTDLYLQWDSHHNLAPKYSVINTLIHRAKAICSNPPLLTKELYHLKKVLMWCKYPWSVINKSLSKQEGQKKTTKKRQIPTAPQTEKKCHIVMSYSQGICESDKTICKNIKYRFILKEDKM